MSAAPFAPSVTEARAAAYSIDLDGDTVPVNSWNAMTFKGFGVLSANSTSALLMDYKSEHPEAYSELLKVLFGGDNPIMTQVKIEMGNDRNTSTGPNPVTMRTEDEPANPARDPGFQLAADAKRMNPDLKVSLLRWREPSWASSAEKQYTWFKNTILAAYRQYGFMVDSLNPNRNEENLDNTRKANHLQWASWVRGDVTGYVSDDPALAGFASDTERDLFRQIQFISDDSSGVTAACDDANTDASFRAALDIIGYHYNTDDQSGNQCKNLATTYDKEIWNSEAQATFSNSAFRPYNNVNDGGSVGTGFGGINSPLEMANTIVKGFVNSYRSHFVYQPAIGAFYYGGQYSHKELVDARDPWSGWIHYDAGLDVLRHFSEFATIGWDDQDDPRGVWLGVPSASRTTATGTNPVNGRNGQQNYLTMSPRDKADFSTVIVNDSAQTHTYTINVTNMAAAISGKQAEVWETRAAGGGERFNANYLKQVADVDPTAVSATGGTYTVTVNPWSIATVTTLDKDSDPAVNKALPIEGERTVLDQESGSNGVLYADDFEYAGKTVPVFDADGEPTAQTESFIGSRGGDTGFDVLYTWDRNGAFEGFKEANGNHVLRQQLDTINSGGTGSAWNGGDPITGIGDARWVNYRAAVDVRFDRDTVTSSANYAAIGARSTGGDNSQSLSSTPYVLRVNADGPWVLQRFGVTQASGTVAMDGEWHNLAIEVAGNQITGSIDQVEVGSFTDPAPVMSGRVDLASGFYFTSFDNLEVTKLDEYQPYYTERLDGMEMGDLASPPNTRLEYTGSWNHRNGESMYTYGRSLNSSTAAGATVGYTFTGTGLDIMGPGNSATLEVTVDGVVIAPSMKTVATGAPFYRTSLVLRGLPHGQHTVTLKVLSGTLVVDSFDTIGEARPKQAPATDEIRDVLAQVASTSRTSEFTQAQWETFQELREQAQAAVTDPEGYGLDAEGVPQIAARLAMASWPGAWSLNDLQLATFAGQAPALPAKVVATNADDLSTVNVPVDWDLDGIEFATSWETVAVTGTYLGLTVTAYVEVVPKDLLYFVDGNGVASGLGAGASALGYDSPAYDLVSQLTTGSGRPLLNTLADQRYTGTATWGHSTYSNATTAVTPSYKGIVAGPYSKTVTTGVYSSNAVGANVRYTFTAPAAGSYVLEFDSYTWWASTGRRTQVYIDCAGCSTDPLAQFALNTTTPLYHGRFQVSVAQPGTITLRLVAVNDAQSPMFSWAALYEDHPAEVGVSPASATVTPGGTQGFGATVTWHSGKQAGEVAWSVAGATSALTGIDAAGVLSAGGDEKAASLDVIATSIDAPAVTGKATVTVLVPDKAQLQAVVDHVEDGLDADLFTTSSWASAIPPALGAAMDVLDDQFASQAEIDAAADELTAAVAELARRGDPAVLKALIDAGNALSAKSAEFTDASMAGLRTALAGGDATYRDRADKTQAQLDAAVATLQSALSGLAVKQPAPAVVDKTVLQHVTTSASALSNAKGSYTAASWSRLQSEIADAKDVLRDGSATQAQVDLAVKELGAALAGLAPAPAKPVAPPAKPVVERVKLNQSQLRLVKGKSLTLEEGVYYSNVHSSYAGEVTWKSSNSTIATVDSRGKVKAKKTGTVTITATTLKPNKAGKKLSTSIRVTVVKQKPRSTVTKVTASVPKTMKVGQKVYITGTYASSKATGVKVTYSSSKFTVADVDKVGRIIAKGKGTATIKVKAGGKSKTYKVTVR